MAARRDDEFGHHFVIGARNENYNSAVDFYIIPKFQIRHKDQNSSAKVNRPRENLDTLENVKGDFCIHSSVATLFQLFCSKSPCGLGFAGRRLNQILFFQASCVKNKSY